MDADNDDDRLATDETQPERASSERAQGSSPVVEAGNRSPVAKIAIVGGLLAVVGFLFLTGGGNSKPQPVAKPPALRHSPGPDSAPAPPPLPALPADEALAGFPPPPVPGQKNVAGANASAATNDANKAEARRRAPMLIYDASAADAAAGSSHLSPADALQSMLVAQLAHSGTGNTVSAGNEATASDDGKAGDAAEQRADRTQAFARTASMRTADEVSARHLRLDNRIAQGRLIAATLETAVASDLPGALRAVVSRDVWSEDGQRRLIRRGARLIGEYRSGLARGQTRVFVIWTRLLQPDGIDIALGSPGTDDLGRAGLTGAIDRHFAERFGASILLSLIGSTTTATQGGSTVVLDTSQSFSRVAEESLRDSINVPPTVLIDQGAPVQVVVGRDLVFGDTAAAVADVRP